MRFYIFAILLICVAAQADWWDDFVDSISTKLHEGAQFVKEKAGPAIREKFDGAKEKLQDPETHADIQSWLKEKVWNPTKQFVTEELGPELKKIYNAAVEGNEKLKEREEKVTNVQSGMLKNFSRKDAINGKSELIDCSCVFNDDLTLIFIENFGLITLNREDLLRLDDIPTPNIVLKCSFELFTNDQSEALRLYKIIGFDDKDQSLAMKAAWNKEKASLSNDVLDEFVDCATDLPRTKKSVITNVKGFITGLTSVFVPDLFTETVILPSHNRKFHSIGREFECDLVYSSILDCYVVSKFEPQGCGRFYTLLRRKSESIEGLFYIDLNIKAFSNGLYQHEFFKHISDPFGFLDVARFAYGSDETKSNRIFTVPIKDRLGRTHDTRNVQALDIITRFEVTSAGDDKAQIERIESLRTKKASLTCGGIVLNANTGIVCGRNYNGIVFKFYDNKDGFATGDAITFKANRITEPTVTRPTFLIVQTEVSKKSNLEKKFCSFEDGKFKLKAKFNHELQCYEDVNKIFGFIPCKKPPPIFLLSTPGSENKLYEITALENPNLSGQTVLFNGEFIREIVLSKSQP